jgi:hypothetical protein
MTSENIPESLTECTELPEQLVPQPEGLTERPEQPEQPAGGQRHCRKSNQELRPPPL